MKEKDIQSIFGKNNKVLGVFELKLCKGKSLPFNAVADHQLYYLNLCEEGKFYYKIPDMSSVGGYSSVKPFDCFKLVATPAYVVLIWYVPRVRKTAYYIRIKEFVRLKEGVDRKSVTEDMAKECSEYVVEF